MASSKGKEVADEYTSSLSDLTINSKPLINMLTMLADDNVEHASSIVQAVENHLQKVRSEFKLPVLYLIDSIVKNVNGSYLSLFTQNIVNTFCDVFEKVDENTRASMWKLRQTWNEVFPANKLFSLDVRVQSIDPAWPITATPPKIPSGSIHVNPRFLVAQTPPPAVVPTVKLPPGDPVSVSEAAMREQLLKKQRELLELQKQKIELELLQAKTSLEQQQRQLDKQAVAIKTETIVPTAHVIPTTDASQSKPVAPVVPSQATKQVAKQFPAAAASLLKNPSSSNGPRIAPASSIAVASARLVSRDPRLKPSTTANDQSSCNGDPRLRSTDSQTTSSQTPTNQFPIISTVITDKLKPVTGTNNTNNNKSTSIIAGCDNSTTLDDINNDITIATTQTNTNNNTTTNNNNNNNNKTNLSGNTNKDVVTHRPSQKKDPRTSSNNNLNINCTKNVDKSSSVCQSTIASITTTNSTSSMARGSGGNDGKSKDSKFPTTTTTSTTTTTTTATASRVSSSSSNTEKIIGSSKSSNRKLGNKTRSKQPQSSPIKIPKVDRDPSSPVRSKSRDKDSTTTTIDDSNNSSIRTSPQTNSSIIHATTKNRKKIVKTRKRSPSPYRIPRRSDTTKSTLSNVSGGVTEEEQSGSLIVSPPHPPAFKDIRNNARQRNYVRRNRDDVENPEITDFTSSNDLTKILNDGHLDTTNKDEDMRSGLTQIAINVDNTSVNLSEKKEDLDLRVLPTVNNKRHSVEPLEPNASKKSKAEKFDALFGNEDVDLRTLTNPKAGRPPTPPPPVISGDDGKDGWAKLKTPTKPDREKQPTGPSNDDKRDRDRNKDRLGRPRLYNKLPDDPKERRRSLSSDDQDSRPSRRGGSRDDKSDRNTGDRNLEIIIKQAAEQLKQGCISNSDYNTLIQEVIHMSEDQKLRSSQRKDTKDMIGNTIVWEKSLNHDVNRSIERSLSSFGSSLDGEISRIQDHVHSRNRNGPRWQNHQPWQQPPGPWAHPPVSAFAAAPPPPPPQPSQTVPFNPDFRPIGPWQNPRHFGPPGPMRPDFPPYHRGFNPNVGPNPRMAIIGPNGPMGPNGPLMSNMIANGPIGPMTMSNTPMQLPPVVNGPPNPIMMNNGPLQSGQITNIVGQTGLLPVNPSLRNLSPNSATNCDLDDGPDGGVGTLARIAHGARDLPPPDPVLLEAIVNDRMKSIEIDGKFLEVRYYGQTGVVFVKDDDPREIGFQDGTRRVLIDDKDTIVCGFNEPYKEFIYDGEVHRIRFGGPSRELYVDDRWYECYFGGMPIKVDLGTKKVSVKLERPPPQVKIGSVKRTDLVVGKINLVVDRLEVTPVFVDAKPQIFKIDGEPQILEFIDGLDGVLLNGRPFKIQFGGLPTVITVRGKKHDFRFARLPAGVRAGYAKIAGMRGDPPKELPQEMIREINNSSTIKNVQASENHDSGSQDNTELPITTGSDPHSTVALTSGLSSTTAPSSEQTQKSGETGESNAAATTGVLTLPLNMNELFQRLVETGIVPNLTEQKKNDDEGKKEPAILPVSFDKPETLKVKQPAIASALYSGIQCSSCGARFAPELATRYSHHLDWHFRQNRRERDSARKAHSRPWYYDVSDWIQFEEIEDLEDRAQSWFETEKLSAETEGTTTDDSPQETAQPSVPTGSDADAPRCHVCHDAFEQFYNEEKEEWHLRPTVRHEEKNYHPLCLEDYKRSLEKSALALEEEEKKAEESSKTPVDEVKAEETAVEKMDVADESEKKIDDDENAKIENDENAEILENTDAKESADVKNVEGEKICEAEEKPSETDDVTEQPDEVAKSAENEITDEKIEEVADKAFENIKIKEEPMDGSEVPESVEDTEFQLDNNVEVKQEPVDPEHDPDENIITESAVVDTTHTAVKSSIDGNVELESRPTAIPTAPSRIKINITKPLNITKEPEETKDKTSTETTPNEETATPLVPAALKPALQGRKLSNLPPVEKGHELSGLCTIM